jgi:hypothetical protein
MEAGTVMSELTTMIEQAQAFAAQHAPAELLQEAVPLAVLLLIGGVGMSVLGAKLSRVAATLAFGVAGGVAGTYFARQSGYSLPVCIGAGVSLFGVIGYQTLRFWVGVLTAGVLCTVALGTFGYKNLVPHVAEFQQSMQVAPSDGDFVFSVPSPEQQEAYRDRSPGQWAKEFWAFVAERDAGLEQGARSIAIIAALTGLFLGVVAMRWALILSTAMLGTGLVTTGMGTLISHYWPEQGYQAFAERPAVFGAIIGGFLVSSLIVQTALTKPAPHGKSESPKKA